MGASEREALSCILDRGRKQKGKGKKKKKIQLEKGKFNCAQYQVEIYLYLRVQQMVNPPNINGDLRSATKQIQNVIATL